MEKKSQQELCTVPSVGRRRHPHATNSLSMAPEKKGRMESTKVKGWLKRGLDP